MWCSFTLITLLGLLRTATSQDNSSSLCIDPTNTPVIDYIQFEVTMIWNEFVKMRAESSTIHPAFALSCGREQLVWDDSLAVQAFDEEGKKCPMEGKPYIPGFKEGKMNNEQLGILTVFGMNYDYLGRSLTSSWKNLIKNVAENKARALVEKYEKGPYDPVFQVLWADTKQVGCAITSYNISDLEAVKKIFNVNTTDDSVFWNVVCIFKPMGSIAGEKAWSYCASSPDDLTTETTPMSTYQTMATKPQNTLTPSSSQPTPVSAATRVRQALGFNFQTITTSILTILFGNRAHFFVLISYSQLIN